MNRLIALLVVPLILGVFPRLVETHPGRLDAKGCHKVWQDWKSADGKRVYTAGTRHCHCVSDAVVLGQDEILVEEPSEKLQQGRDRAKDRQR